jgi:hypothetical protein
MMDVVVVGGGGRPQDKTTSADGKYPNEAGLRRS